MNDDTRLVWSDEEGDLRKKKPKNEVGVVDESKLELELRRLTSGKGRAIVEIKGLPNNKLWCKKLAQELKKTLGVGGAYKSTFIEIHGEKMEEILAHLQSRSIKFKKTGG